MLVQTVEDLEQAACNKVKLLEQKLNQSSMIVSENLPSFNDTGKVRFFIYQQQGKNECHTSIYCHRLYTCFRVVSMT